MFSSWANDQTCSLSFLFPCIEPAANFVPSGILCVIGQPDILLLFHFMLRNNCAPPPPLPAAMICCNCVHNKPWETFLLIWFSQLFPIRISLKPVIEASVMLGNHKWAAANPLSASSHCWHSKEIVS